MGEKVVRAAIAGGVAAIAWRVTSMSAGHDDWWMLLIFLIVAAVALFAERHIV